MIARLQRGVLLVRLIANGALAWFLVRHTSLPTGLALTLAIVLCQQPAMIAIDFALARYAKSAIPGALQIGLMQSLRTYLQEVGCASYNFSWSGPFFSTIPAPAPVAPLQSLPVLFIHGYCCNSGIWNPLMREVASKGYRCKAISMEPAYASIDAYAEQIENALQKLLTEHGSASAILVCHSMGGLAARAWMRRYGNTRAASVITLGTPHHGTVHAHFGHGTNAREMRPNSLWLQQLEHDETAETCQRIISIWSHHDCIIAPQQSSHLEGAHNIPLSGYGHVALVYARPVWQLLLAEMGKIGDLSNSAIVQQKRA